MPRKGILEALERQLRSGDYAGRMIHLCFTCDPFPYGVNPQVTLDAVKLLKDAGAHVQVLTKRPLSGLMRTFHLLGSEDMFGTTITGADGHMEPNAEPVDFRVRALDNAHELGIGTWVSCEPIIDPNPVYDLIRDASCIDLFKFGKLNYAKTDLDWKRVAAKIVDLCEMHGREYVLKKSLRDELECDAA